MRCGICCVVVMTATDKVLDDRRKFRSFELGRVV